jgi:RNA polymerase sigma-70 factor (ECF subfamily)
MPGPAVDDPGLDEHSLDPGVGWMLRYQRGDELAFDRLVERYSPRVYALLTRFLGPAENREDLVQEVFLRVIRARTDYRPEARFSTWLYRIAFNLCVNESERRRPCASLEDRAGERLDGWLDERAPAPLAALECEDLVTTVRAAIAALPARQRMALLLAKYEELPYDAVGEVLGTSEKAVKSMIHRARETLRARLSSFLEEEVA